MGEFVAGVLSEGARVSFGNPRALAQHPSNKLPHPSLLILCLSIALALSLIPPAQPAQATTPLYYSQTGYAIADPAFLDYFAKRGGVNTFGYPVSREFTLGGFPVQVFQRAVFQRYPDGHVQLLNLLDPGLFPYTVVNGATFPAVDLALVQTAPVVGSANYGSAVLSWLAAVAPDAWHGLPVHFHETFLDSVDPKVALGTATVGSASIAGLDLEIWGVPTSQPAFDPNNSRVVYQRFQRGILQYDSSCGCTRGVLLADYFKAVLLGANLPADLQAAAQDSPYYAQYDPAAPAWVAHPNLLAGTDLTDAFEREPNPGAAASGSALPAAPVRVGAGAPPAVNAASIAVVDEASGALLYGVDPHHELAPASLTKIFTALVALRYGNLQQTITAQFDPSQLTDSTLMGIHPGETYTLEDLLAGLLLPSGNDAALAIANGIGGSETRFVGLMNAEATDLGLPDSHFVNPHGLDAPGHYSSAADLALAARYGMIHDPEFAKLVGRQSWTVHGTRSFTMTNLNRFLRDYPGADGVKIGYTDNAGHTIVASATRNGHRVYVALMNCGDIVNDSVPLFDWVFANFQWKSG